MTRIKSSQREIETIESCLSQVITNQQVDNVKFTGISGLVVVVRGVVVVADVIGSFVVADVVVAFVAVAGENKSARKYDLIAGKF